MFEPAALRGHRLFESRDLDQTRERISTVMQPHRLLPGGRAGGVRSHMDFVRIGGIGLGTIAFGTAMRVDVDSLANYHLLMFCLRGGSKARVGDTELAADASHGVVSAPGQRFTAELSADCEQFVMRLDRDTVQAHTGRRDLRWHAAVDLGTAALSPLLDVLQGLLRTPALLALAQRNALLATDIERLLIHLLQAGQPWHGEPDATERRGIVPACVRRAEEYMEAHVALPLRLADLALAAGVAPRTLHDAFQRFRGHSPMQGLQAMRLQRAHQLLRRGGDDMRVADIALECGFAHFGRFAESYRQQFGELPSATLRPAGTALRSANKRSMSGSTAGARLQE